VLHAARRNTGCKKSPKIRHLSTISQICRAVSSQLKYVSTIGKNLLNSNISFICPHNMVNVGPFAAEIGLPVWCAPANFNGFRVLASLLQRRRSTEVSQTLHTVWPSPHIYTSVYIFGALAPNGVLQRAKFTLRLSLAFSYIGSVNARHSSSGCQPNFTTLNRGCHLYSAGPPSRWALAHILVYVYIVLMVFISCCFYVS